MYLNEATLLNNVRVRYSKDKIYVSIFSVTNVVMKILYVIHLKWQDVLNTVAERTQRAANEKTHANRKKHLQIKKTSSSVLLTTQPNTETFCKYSQHNHIQKRAANTHKTTKYRNVLQILKT